MKRRLPARRLPARQRLLTAAARVFARDGLNGATTRAIAREAGVNEVTLFRLFQSKDRLIAAVVGQNFGGAAGAPPSPIPPVTADLRSDLAELARRYEKVLQDNWPLVRTMLGEIQHHHRDQERQVFESIFRPLKKALLARLMAARKAGLLQPGTRPDVVADLLGGMIFTGVLRRTRPHYNLAYSAGAYLGAAVDLVLRGATRETSLP
jgi:AcrR family transcriptional regulator